MAIDLDGYKVLRRIGKNPETFVAITLDVKKAARTLVVKQLKATATSLKDVRGIRGALGGENFKLVVDGMTDSELKSLAAKLDKGNPELKTAAAAELRAHVHALADGSAETAAKPSKGSAAGKRARSSAKTAAKPKPLNSLAIAATVSRRD